MSTIDEEETERRLAAVPTRQLSEEARQQITNAILATTPQRRARWWSRTIPVWQAAAACLVIGLIGVLATASFTASVDPGDAQPAGHERIEVDVPGVSTFVSVDPAVFGLRRRPVYRTDIARWRVIQSSAKGDNSP